MNMFKTIGLALVAQMALATGVQAVRTHVRPVGQVKAENAQRVAAVSTNSPFVAPVVAPLVGQPTPEVPGETKAGKGWNFSRVTGLFRRSATTQSAPQPTNTEVSAGRMAKAANAGLTSNVVDNKGKYALGTAAVAGVATDRYAFASKGMNYAVDTAKAHPIVAGMIAGTALAGGAYRLDLYTKAWNAVKATGNAVKAAANWLWTTSSELLLVQLLCISSCRS